MGQPTQKTIRDLRRFLREIQVAALATVDDRGLPYVVNVYVAIDEQVRFYFVSDPASRHSQHLMRQPHVSLAGYAPIRMWQQVRGIQVQGVCESVEPEHRQGVWETYRQWYPYIDEVTEYVRAMAFYRVTPDRIRWIDNSVHFGFKVDLDWPLPSVLDDREG